jgi:hypothetical protein
VNVVAVNVVAVNVVAVNVVAVNVVAVNVVALAGFESAPGLCVILAPDGTSVAVPRADEGDGPVS